jgi:hypothetical protein
MSGSSFLGLLTLGLIGHIFIRSDGNGFSSFKSPSSTSPQPPRMMLHPGVDPGDKLIWLSCDDRASMDPVGGSWIFPALPKTGKDEWAIILHPNREWNLRPANRAPLVKPISRNKASPLLERPAVRRRRVHGFSSCVDCLVSDFWISGPVGDQTPSQCVQCPLLCVWIVPDRQNLLCRRNVVRNRKIQLRRDRNLVNSAEFFFARCSTIAAAHTF